MFIAAFQRRTQALGVLGLGGGPLVVTPTAAMVVAVCFAPEPQPARVRPAAIIGIRTTDRFMTDIFYVRDEPAVRGHSGTLT